MNFYYYGRKPSKGYDVASGCLLFIGFGAIILFFSVIDSLSDLEGHYLELFFLTIVTITTIFGLFRKKAKLHTNRIEIKNKYLSVNKINIPLDKVNLDIYTSKGEFMRYHLWDSNGLFAIFSVFEDDLCIYFQEKHINQTLFFEEISSKNDGGYISLKSNNRKLNYNIEVGSFTLKENNTETISLTPEVYVYDPKYKQGKPLLKK